jgi:RNA processing factor Prp31
MSEGQVKAIVDAITHLAQVMEQISDDINGIDESIREILSLAHEELEKD